MDPQLSYTFEGWNAMYDIYVPLLTYRHADGKAGVEIVPGLAESLPKVTNRGRTYTLFLRQGLQYSDGTPVKASDFEYAVKRMFKLNSGGSFFYTVIVGARRFARTGRGGISGIVTNNRTGKIVIHLVKPDTTFTDLLALMFAAPVPDSTPMWDQSFHPPPATGPYAITSLDASSWSYARNPAWESSNGGLPPQLPDGEFDRIQVRVVRNPAAEVRAVLSGKADWMQNPLPPTRFPSLWRRFKGTRLRVDRAPSTYYFWMNTRKPPFNDLRVRRAANYAVNSRALKRIYGGLIAPTHQILPPEVPGFRRFNLYPYNLAKARRLVAAADPADHEITVWTDNEYPNYEAGAYFASRLRKIGLHVHLKVVSADFYFSVIGNQQRPNLDAGWSDWFADFAHPDDFFRPMLLGSSVLRFNNGNFAQIDVPRLDSRVEKLREKQLRPGSERAYASLDRGYMKLAPWVPYGTRVLSTFVSKRVDLDRVAWNPLFGADIASFRTK
jgi:peptide/nickel transport system substrate-binding protein